MAGFFLPLFKPATEILIRTTKLLIKVISRFNRKLLVAGKLFLKAALLNISKANGLMVIADKGYHQLPLRRMSRRELLMKIPELCSGVFSLKPCVLIEDRHFVRLRDIRFILPLSGVAGGHSGIIQGLLPDRGLSAKTVVGRIRGGDMLHGNFRSLLI